MRRTVAVNGRPSFVDKRALIFVNINSTHCLDQVHSLFISWVAALVVTLDQVVVARLAVNPGQVPVESQSLAASLDQVAVEESATCYLASAATLDQVAAVFHLAQSDAWPLEEKSRWAAKFLVVKRSEEQSRRCQAVALGQDDRETVGVDAQDAQERLANLGQDDQEMAANLDQGALEVWVILDQDRPAARREQSDEMDDDQEEQTRQGGRCNTRFQRVLMS
jgi:hypothetical protein